MKKRFLALLLAALMVVSLLPTMAFAAVTLPEGAAWIDGTGTVPVWYKLTDSNTVLTIGGTGAMPDFTSGNPAPWKEYADKIETVVIGSGVTAIGSDAFYNFKALTSVTIPSSVTTIKKQAFYWCDKLTNVILPNGVMSIGDYAFASCIELTSVTIPSSVTSIGEDAFQNCRKLTAVIKATTPPTLGDTALDDAIAIYIPAGTLNTYESATNWEYFGPEYGDKLKEAYVVDVVAATHGTVTVDRDFVAKDETVNVTVTPDTGYQLKSLVWNDGTDHDITEAKSFTMPTANVTVKAEFEIAHIHTYAKAWTTDATNHWHAATCEHTSEKADVAAHADNNKDHKCDVCGYVMSQCVDSNHDNKCDICGKKLGGTGGHHSSTTTTPTVSAPKTADMGVAIYGVLGVSALLGTGWVVKKKDKDQ